MRTRPPDLTGREVASSNTTLNAFLGNRQKSWMTGSNGSTVRPTPRPQATQRTNQSGVLPSPAPSDEPSPVQTNQEIPITEIRVPQAQIPQVRPQGTYVPPAEPHPQILSSQIENHQLAILQPRQSSQTPLSTEIRSPSIQHTQALPSLPPRSITPDSGQAETLQQVPNKTQTKHSLAPASNPPRPSVTNIPSLKVRIPLIDEYIRVNGGLTALNAWLERPRFLLLRDACNNDDYFYVALHQLFCIWSLNKSLIARIDGFDDEPLISVAFQILGKLIRENDGLSSNHMKWFSEFPSPINDLLSRSDQYRQNIKLVKDFLSNLASKWSILTQQYEQRGYPPLVDEMVNDLGLISRVLQSVFFTATRRNLGIKDDDIGAEMQKLFTKDREGHRDLALRYNTAFPPTAKEINERNARLAERYIHLRNRQTRDSQPPYHPHLVTSENGFSVPVLPSTSGAQTVFRHGSVAQNGPSERSVSLQGSDLYRSPQNISVQRQAGSPTSMSPPTPHGNSVANTPLQSSAFSAPQQSSPQHQTQWRPSILHSNFSQNYRNTSLPPQDPQAVQYMQQSGPLPSQYFIPNQRHTYQIVNHPQSRQPPGPPVDLRAYDTNQALSRSSFSVNSQPQGVNHTQMRATSAQGPHQGSVAGARVMSHYRGQQVPSKTANHDALFPQRGVTLAAHAPNPDITALHQAHLRSPVLTHKDAPLAGRLYQTIRNCVVGPVALNHAQSLFKFEFRIAEEVFHRVASDTKTKIGAPPSRSIQRGSLQYRLRCIQLKHGERDINIADWVVADNQWPPTIFIEINDKSLEVRRKNLHGKDLPVDITPDVVSAGANVVNRIKIALPVTGKRQKEHYAFAVEAVEILHHQQIVDTCQRYQRIASEQTLNNIKTSLSGPIADDDEILMVAGDLTIDLADPFTAKIFEVPVRGKTCLHRECFDLETFLNTRTSKPKRPDQPSMVDVWKCPLCGKDARPYSLQVDDFLVSVRETLAGRGLLDSKAIIISADGNWVPKIEPKRNKRTASKAGFDEDDSDEESELERQMKTAIVTQESRGGLGAPTRTKDIEIIELDDD